MLRRRCRTERKTPIAKPPTGEHTGFPSRVGSCTPRRGESTNESLNVLNHRTIETDLRASINTDARAQCRAPMSETLTEIETDQEETNKIGTEANRSRNVCTPNWNTQRGDMFQRIEPVNRYSTNPNTPTKQNLKRENETKTEPQRKLGTLYTETKWNLRKLGTPLQRVRPTLYRTRRGCVTM